MQEQVRENVNEMCARLEQVFCALDGALAGLLGQTPDSGGGACQLAEFWQTVGGGAAAPLSPAEETGFGALIMAALCDALKATETQVFNAGFDRACWEKDIRRTFGALSAKVLEKQTAAGLYGGGRLPLILQEWPQIAALLDKAPDYQSTAAALQKSGLAPERLWQAHSHEQVIKAVVFAKDLHTGYTLLWLLRDTGLLEPFAKRVVLEHAPA